VWGWLPGRLILSGPCSWVRAGRGAAARGKQGGWLVLWCLACVVGAGVGLVAWCWHRRHARLVVGCCGCCGRGGRLVGGCPCVVWGWHAVGVLGQCALVAWPAFSASLFVGGVGVGVGGLVVNCIVDASILL